jgi:5'-3' exonuclease
VVERSSTSLREMPQPLLAVDAPSLLFRAFYALPDTITDKDGQPVNALLGAFNMVLNVVASYHPRAVVLCFGPDAAVYRKQLYEPYHAARPEVPSDLDRQFAEAREFFEAFGWTVTWSEDHEADDLLGSYARAEEEAGGTALVLTGDRDMYQCATERTMVLFVKTGTRGVEEVDPAEVKRRYGVAPEQVPDFIALRGDPSDGLPGGKGIGEKTAADLLARHGTLDGALEAWSRESSARVRGALKDQREELETFKEIATLRTVPVELPPDRETDFEGGAEMARERGMNQLAGRLGRGSV